MKYTKATVKVKLEPSSGGKSPGVRSKITTFIGGVRVGRETFDTNCEKDGALQLADYDVAVPHLRAPHGAPQLADCDVAPHGAPQLADCDVAVPHRRAPHIEVDLEVESSKNQWINHLKVFKLAHGIQSYKVDSHEVVVDINWDQKIILGINKDEEQEYIIRTSRPRVGDKVKIKMGPGEHHLTVEYTIDDAVFFIEFIMTLRSVLADHPDEEDILDGHGCLNLSSTREHPLLPKQRAEQPARWLHVKLQVVDGKKTYSTTLLMRDDNLYVLGFMNQEKTVYELQDNTKSVGMLKDVYKDAKSLLWKVSYSSIVGVDSITEVAHKLAEAGLGRSFMMDAVRRLSSSIHPDEEVADMMNARIALAGLIVMVCESARINPLLDSFALKWSYKSGFDKDLMERYALRGNYRTKSEVLRKWKGENCYAEQKDLPQPVDELQAIYLVLNGHTPSAQIEDKSKAVSASNAGGGGHSGNARRSGPNDNAGRGGRSGNAGRGGGRSGKAGRGGDNRKRGTNDSNSDSWPKKARTAGSGSPARKSEEAGDAGSGGGPASQAGAEASDAGSGGGSTSQHGDGGEAGDAGPSQDNNGKAGESKGPSQHKKVGDDQTSEEDSDQTREDCNDQPKEDDNNQGHGQPLVELLAMRANLRVVGTKIIVFDGKRGQIIYMHKEQGREQGRMVELVLTGPYTGISAYGSFAIKIDIPNTATPIKWVWDGYDLEYAAEVDELPVTREIHNVAEVIYAVMSNALEATVQVMLRLKDGQSPSGVHGEITARIHGFDDVSSILFKCTEGAGQCFSPDTASDSDSWFLLQLARNVVAVPCGKVLHINVKLEIKTSNNQEVKYLKADLKFANGIPSQRHKDNDGDEVEVKIIWYPEIAQPNHPPEQTIEDTDDSQRIVTAPLEQIGPPEVKMMPGHLCEVVYTIGDELSFMSFMINLRRILANHQDHEDILDRHCDSNLSSTREHPLLPKQRAEEPARWVHIKLQLEETSTTLLMRDDNLYVCGFMNQQGVCYELLDDEDSENLLPSEYNSERLYWGVKYRTILDVAENEQAEQILEHIVRWGIRDFAVTAVCVLSRYPEYVEATRKEHYYHPGRKYDMNPRVALAGLILMVCECARMNSFCNSIACDHWNEDQSSWDDVWKYGNMGTGRKEREDLRWDDVWKYGEMSHGLRQWKSRNYTRPPVRSLQAIYLVLNTRLTRGGDDTDSRRSGYQQYGGRYKRHWRPRVELLTIRADLGVIGTKIIIYDGKRGQVIYRKKEQGEQEVVDLVLTGPNTGISALGCFGIKVDIPSTATAGPGSSRGDAGSLIKWEWDCDDSEFAAEVDKEKTVTISSSGPGRNVQVIYAVMPYALDATVQVKLRLKDGHSPSVHGNITARIGKFEARSILFRRTESMGQRFSPIDSRFLQLARSVVAVPRGWVLYIEVDLQIETSNNKGCKHLKVVLEFDDGILCRSPEVDGDEIEVNVTWSSEANTELQTHLHVMPRQRQPDISYVIGDEGGFRRFIEGLRNTVADHPPRREVVFDPSSKRSRPVMSKSNEERRWLQIKLQVAGEERWTTLALSPSSLEVLFFSNQNGDWCPHEFPPSPSPWMLTDLNKPVLLQWGSNYTSILKARNKEEVVKILDSARLGKTFAAHAVRVLSRYPDVADGDNPRLALVGLSVMVCESAKMNRLHKAIADDWETGAKFTTRLLDYIENWERISRALLVWKDHSCNCKAWIKDERLERIGINSQDEALDVVHLVRSVPIPARWLGVQLSVTDETDYKY